MRGSLSILPSLSSRRWRLASLLGRALPSRSLFQANALGHHIVGTRHKHGPHVRDWEPHDIIAVATSKLLAEKRGPHGQNQTAICRDDKSVTKIGKKVYPTREKAEADVKRLCKQ